MSQHLEERGELLEMNNILSGHVKPEIGKLLPSSNVSEGRVHSLRKKRVPYLRLN